MTTISENMLLCRKIILLNTEWRKEFPFDRNIAVADLPFYK